MTLRYEVYASRNVKEATSCADNEIVATYQPTNCYVQGRMELQGRFDTIAEAALFCHMLHTCGKWTMTHINEVSL